MLKYEVIKLAKKKMFLVLTALLLVANLFTVYIREKETPEFAYVFEQRAQYQAFLAGEETADSSGYYTQEREQQEQYIASYPDFIEGMAARAEQMGSVSVFSDPDSYVYRNLLKTCRDFQKMNQRELKLDNCFGIRSFCEYSFGVIFMLIFLAVLTYEVIFYERDRNLMLLLKGTRRGYVPTAAAKLAVMLSAAALYTFVQESLTFLMYGILYGYGDVNRLIQSVSLFRNCPHLLTVAEAALFIFVIRAAVAVFFAVLFFCIGMCMKNQSAAAVCSMGVTALLFFGARKPSACINPFYCWDMERMLGEYYNLNLAGMPIGKEICITIAWAVFVLLIGTCGILAYTRTCQIKEESRIESFLRWLRGKMAFLHRSRSLLYYEFYKILIQQKKVLLVLLLLVVGIQEVRSVFGTQYYANAQGAAYHYYINQYGGKITEETLDAVRREEAHLNELWDELYELGDQPTGADGLRQTMIQAELDKKEQGFFQVQMQLEALQERPGAVTDKYLIDELTCQELWNDAQGDVSLWLAGSLVLLFLICGIRSMDEKRNMTGLLHATKRGFRELSRSQTACAVWCSAFVCFCMEFPIFLRYMRIGLSAVVKQKMCDFTIRPFTSEVSLLVFVAVVFGLKLLAFLVTCLLGQRLTRMFKSELPAFLAGAGFCILAAAVFYWLNRDIELILIQFL